MAILDECAQTWTFLPGPSLLNTLLPGVCGGFWVVGSPLGTFYLHAPPPPTATAAPLTPPLPGGPSHRHNVRGGGRQPGRSFPRPTKMNCSGQPSRGRAGSGPGWRAGVAGRAWRATVIAQWFLPFVFLCFFCVHWVIGDANKLQKETKTKNVHLRSSIFLFPIKKSHGMTKKAINLSSLFQQKRQ